MTPSGSETGDFLQSEEGIAYATFDLADCVEPKQFHDVVGYYNRFDVFDLSVSRRRIVPITFHDTPVRGPNREERREAEPGAQGAERDGDE